MLFDQLIKEGEINDKVYRNMVYINNNFRESLLTPITVASFDPTYDSQSNVISDEITLGSSNKTVSYAYCNEN